MFAEKNMPPRHDANLSFDDNDIASFSPPRLRQRVDILLSRLMLKPCIFFMMPGAIFDGVIETFCPL